MAASKYKGIINEKNASGVKPSPKKSPVIYNTGETGSNLIASDYELIYGHRQHYIDDVSLLRSSKKGLDAKAALDFILLSGFSHDEFQETFKTTVKTIQNYAVKALTLDAALSEKLLKAFALFEKGSEIFGSAKCFLQWLKTPAYGLGNQLPFDLMDTITGIQLIEEELIRIEFGALA
jgi:putative toxin-antitoxin system antitoxin component (TIGR02293 family)